MPTSTQTIPKYELIRIGPESFVNMDFADIRTRVKESLSQKRLSIVLEFMPGSYLYSRVAAFLVECYRMIRCDGGRLMVVSADPDFLRVLRTTQLDRMVMMVSTIRDLM